MTLVLDQIVGLVGARKSGPWALNNPAIADIFGGASTLSGVDVDEDVALTESAYFCGMTLLSNAMQIVPVHLYRRHKGGDGRDHVRDHPAFTMLHRRPNPGMRPGKFKWFMQSCALAWGRGLAEIERRRDGKPLNLWPIHPSRVMLRLDDVGKLIFHVHLDDGTYAEIPDEDMFHHFGPTKDGRTGMSIVNIAREAIGLSKAHETYVSKFYSGGAHPRGMIKRSGKFKDDAAFNSFRRRWDSVYQGSPNAHKTLILEDGWDYTQVGMPHDAAQLFETFGAKTEIIARFMNLPPHMLKDLRRATFSNIYEQDSEFVKYSCMPWWVDFEQEANRKLLSEKEQEDHYFEFMVDAILRASPKERAECLQIRRRNGIINADEWRQKDNENAIPTGEGQVYLVESNMTTAAHVARGENIRSGGGGEKKTKGGAFAMSVDDAKLHAMPLFVDAAERIVRREAKACRRAAAKYAGDAVAFANWADRFYAEHGEAMVGAFTPSALSLGRLIGTDIVSVVEWCNASSSASKTAAIRNAATGTIDAWCDGRLVAFPPGAAAELTDLIAGAG